ncbi:DUF6602 domain-containing protein [Paenibacillus sp. L3-i20]|uniref:DUF6602 domain-containing protein n=1 Tax=Paenibacillus sp. L3-i20 TaxID=2905833 RepID=UPI001EDE60A0|nr:DUF6602 domain-containing protein [Paenibacillus sp. L3-i20]GKU76472.1 hypothetical protein L3i20_v208690 [Paenibacillus sp. L3-i20]
MGRTKMKGTDNKRNSGKHGHRQPRESSKLDIMKKVVENYKLLESNVVTELDYGVEHHLTSGVFREGVWKEMFEKMIPRKFAIEQSVFIVDSEMNVSKEVDLAIFDEQYTPYIFRYGNIKYIPIEAVAVVIQCKSTNVTLNKLKPWVNSIKKLQTSPNSVVRTVNGINYGEHNYNQFIEYHSKQATQVENQDSNQLCSKCSARVEKLSPKTTQTSTRPIRILCHTKKDTTEIIESLFDITICRSTESNKLSVSIPRESNDITLWSHRLNHVSDNSKDENFGYSNKNVNNEIKLKDYRVKSRSNKLEEISLLSLTFQLNQLLMLINNPIFFPHRAYVKMFNDILEADQLDEVTVEN